MQLLSFEKKLYPFGKQWRGWKIYLVRDSSGTVAINLRIPFAHSFMKRSGSMAGAMTPTDFVIKRVSDCHRGGVLNLY